MKNGKTKWIALGSALTGMVVGALVAIGLGWMMMPSMMIETAPSRLTFEKTVATIEKSIVENGWVHSGTKDMQKSLAAQGIQYPHRVKLIELCKPEYAQSVLDSDRQVSTLMPCAIAVYEDDDGNVMISRMNTGLMGTLFGGNIAEVMGDKISRDEAKILKDVLEG